MQIGSMFPLRVVFYFTCVSSFFTPFSDFYMETTRRDTAVSITRHSDVMFLHCFSFLILTVFCL